MNKTRRSSRSQEEVTRVRLRHHTGELVTVSVTDF